MQILIIAFLVQNMNRFKISKIILVEEHAEAIKLGKAILERDSPKEDNKTSAPRL
jgi:hypothetical protein